MTKQIRRADPPLKPERPAKRLPKVEPENDRALAKMLAITAILGTGLWILVLMLIF